MVKSQSGLTGEEVWSSQKNTTGLKEVTREVEEREVETMKQG